MAFPFAFDAARMQAEVEQLEAGREWHVHPDYTVVARRGDWTALPLIAADKADPDDPVSLRHPRGGSGPTALLARCPYIQEVIASFRTEVHRARLMNLRPGTEIAPHRDYGEQRYSLIRGYIRVHIPIRTHPQVYFYIGGKPIPMTAGSAWYTNVCNLHAVRNLSSVHRVHLVLDMKVNDWVLGFFPPLSMFDRALGSLLVRYERPYLRARLRLRSRYARLRTVAGDLGLRRLKRRLQG
jgi:hypothetical protein